MIISVYTFMKFSYSTLKFIAGHAQKFYGLLHTILCSMHKLTSDYRSFMLVFHVSLCVSPVKQFLSPSKKVSSKHILFPIS